MTTITSEPKIIDISIPQQRLGILLLPQFSFIALSASIEPYRAANDISGETLYSWTIISADGEPVRGSNGIPVVPQASVTTEDKFDAVIVVAGGAVENFHDPGTFAYLRRCPRMGTSVIAVSTAPYVLARAGLLDDRRCTIHWEHMDAFKEDFPHVDVTDELYEIDGPITTCSGGTAGLDLMLHLITERHGHALAATISEWFMHPKIRDRSEHQRMTLRQRVGVSHPKLLAAIELMEDNLEAPLEREDLAEAVNLSTRQLERLFRKYLGSSPRKYYFGLRMLRARALLRQTTMSVLDVALACGFVSASHFAKCYREHFGDSPRSDRGLAKQGW